MRSAFALSWNVQWLGSFPVSGTDPDTVSLRLDRFTPKTLPIAVQLSVSVIGVKVCALDDKRPLLCHSLRRVNCVIGRTERCQVAYIAREPTGETYRRLCHLFYTDAPHQVEEIESVLGNAFQAAALAHAAPTAQLPPKATQRIVVPPVAHNTAFNNPSTPTVTTSMLMASEVTSKQRPMCSSALLNRFFGSKSKADSNIFNKEKCGGNSAKRRRRPVSAVFTQALHRLSSTSIYNKRVYLLAESTLWHITIISSVQVVNQLKALNFVEDKP
ncbi:SH2 domain-containing protein 5 [Toxocara canis]|uniref:SH2 domain-containing protein 5 n=1 Tax=Toxocara canis TaxID=6265 RepID=A0A0B2VU16_TOXCA|nr:SH2 domain-containing protein 5 [Toxocara canis]